jgi:hypothetical protein
VSACCIDEQYKLMRDEVCVWCVCVCVCVHDERWCSSQEEDRAAELLV